MNIGSAPTICGSSIKGPSVVGVSATGFGLRPPPFTDTPTTDSHLDCRYARILSVAAQFWPLWVAAMLGAEVAVHLMRILMPAIVPRAYVDALAVWSWVAQTMLISATFRHRSRIKQRGVDRPWKS